MGSRRRPRSPPSTPPRPVATSASSACGSRSATGSWRSSSRASTGAGSTIRRTARAPASSARRCRDCSSAPRVRSTRARSGMPWDFATEPEFERQLDWMRAFVREEIWPIETLEDELDQHRLERIYAPLRAQVKQRGLWAAHLPPELGGQGFGQVRLGLMHEILGSSIYAPNAFGCQAPDSGNSEILALAGTPEQKRRWLAPLLAGEIFSGFSMTEPDTPGSDPTQLRSR